MGKDVVTKQHIVQISVLLSNILKTFLILLYFMCCITVTCVQLQFSTYSFVILVQFFARIVRFLGGSCMVHCGTGDQLSCCCLQVLLV